MITRRRPDCGCTAGATALLTTLVASIVYWIWFRADGAIFVPLFKCMAANVLVTFTGKLLGMHFARRWAAIIRSDTSLDS